MHFDVVLSVFIHPCTQKRRRDQYSRRVDGGVCVCALQMCVCVCVCTSDVCVCVCVCALQMCVCARSSYVCARLRGNLLTQRTTVTPTIPSVLSSPGTWDWTRMHALAVMHRRTLYENVKCVKIKVRFYTTDIDILRVASMNRFIIHCIDPYRWIVTPLVDSNLNASD